MIHLGYDPVEAQGADSETVPDFPYFYYPAATYHHKGHAQLFRTFSQLKKEGKLTQKLVLTGGRNRYWKELQKVIQEEAMQDDIIHLGHVSYEDVLALYQGADAVLFPTEFEGFGIPVLEAAQLKKKIICSRLSVFDELGVPAEWQIDFTSSPQLFQALCQEGPVVLKKTPVSWREAVLQTLQSLRELV